MMRRRVVWLAMLGLASGCVGPDPNPDSGADTSTARFVAAYQGRYRATRMQTSPTARTTQEEDPGYNIVASDAGGSAVLFQVTTTCSFRATSRGLFLAVESGQRCIGFPGGSGMFVSTGGTAQRDGNELTLTIAGDYTSNAEGQSASGLYTWTYTGRPR